MASRRHDPPKSWHSVLTGKNLVGPLHHLGWLHGQLPKFEKIKHELSEAPQFMPLSTMRDTTARSIIGGLLDFINDLEQRSADTKSATQTEIIEFLLKRYRDYPGIAKSSLEKVFGEANKFIDTFGVDVKNSSRSAKRRSRIN